MMRCLPLALVTLLAVAGPVAAQTTEKAPSKPGTTFQFRAKTPEPDKWVAKRDGNNPRTHYDCKPLACADKVRITISASKSPTRNPDPQALEKLAKVDLPKAARAAHAAREIMSDGAESVETMVSETTKLHGYPAVVNETKYSKPNNTTYRGTVIIFAGPAMVRVESVSPNQALMKKSLDDFIRVMEFDPNAPAPAPKKPAGNVI
jgi:hypothetical protein